MHSAAVQEPQRCSSPSDPGRSVRSEPAEFRPSGPGCSESPEFRTERSRTVQNRRNSARAVQDAQNLPNSTRAILDAQNHRNSTPSDPGCSEALRTFRTTGIQHRMLITIDIHISRTHSEPSDPGRSEFHTERSKMLRIAGIPRRTIYM